MNVVQISFKSRKQASVLHKRLVSAFDLNEQLTCVLPIAKIRAMRQSEKKATHMSLSEKQAQVALFHAVM